MNRDDKPDPDVATLDGIATDFTAGPIPGLRPSVVDVLPKLALDRALGRSLRRRLTGRSVAVVVTVPSPDWCGPIEKAVRFISPTARVVVRDGTDRFNHKPSKGNSEVASVLNNGRGPVVGISHDPQGLLPSTLFVLADAHAVVAAPPDADTLRKLMSLCIGRPPRNIPDSLGSGLTFDEFVGAFRHGASPSRVVANLASASAAKSRSSRVDTTPPLDQLPGYSGEALQFAFDLADQLAAWRRGEILFSDITTQAAVLHGPPGTGKSLYARALAKMCGLSFVPTGVQDWFANSKGALGDVIVAAAASWADAKSSRPSLYFIDEIDGLPDRSKLDADRGSWWNPVCDFVLTHILDGSSSDRTGIVVLAATNNPSALDPALVRPGRLERMLELLPPDAKGLAEILSYHIKGALKPDALLPVVRLTRGATGANAASWARDACRLARAAGRDVSLADIMAVVAPPDTMSPRDRKIAAIHEAGHAIVALGLGRKVSAVSIAGVKNTGGAASMVDDLSEFPPRADIEDLVAFLMGGRAAEVVVCGSPTVGAGSDLAAATSLVASLHASAGLGADLVHLARPENAVSLLAIDPALRRAVGDELARIHERAVAIVRKNQRAVEALADALQRRRFLEGDEAAAIARGATSKGPQTPKNRSLQ